jgi:archaellin
MVVRLGSGSVPIKLADLLIKMDTTAGSQTVDVIAIDGAGAATNSTYNVSYISNSGVAASANYISTGDLAEISFLKDANPIGEGETATIRLLTKNGAVKPVDLTTPSAMTQTTTYLFP